MFGYEVNVCDYPFRHGLPYATGTAEADHRNPGSVFFIGDHDAQAVAYQRSRRIDAAAVDQARRGSGMVAYFERGKGSVFNAGSCEWVSGLIEHDPFVERLTKNVLIRFTQALPGRRQP